MRTYQMQSVSEASAVKPQMQWFLGPIIALIYPFLLICFNTYSVKITQGAGVAAWLMAGLVLMLAIFMPLIGLSCAIFLGRNPMPSAAEVLARRVALVSGAVAPIFVFTGVIFLLLGKPTWDIGFLTVVWTSLIGLIAITDKTPRQPKPLVQGKNRVRFWHGVAAAAVVVYLGFHFSNHFFGLIGPEAHTAVMKVFRVVYRSAVIEPLLTLTFVFLIGSGAFMAWRLTDRQADAIRTFQIAGGVFLVFAITSHINAVLYLARVHFQIDTDWGFAVGAPTGMLKDPWSIRLLPYYFLAVFYVISHAFCGLRGVMLAHNASERTAGRVLAAGMVMAALVAIIIILAMSGMRVHFD
ncbi:hypothetical protein K9857_01350 [Pseudomonas sp. REP124]|uniref:hypothetical protein n=1 Tax=Pseudomonas sp. REP124 TaxID=2875731 RepID=UPI001CCED049|nr:hypothetical protein [Pseudomonas sp. REP124]MBZ9780198.1 hypothetical protein [Pseudomonas sp. REP124]